MKKAKKSLGFALQGLVHGFKEERNIRLFVYGHIVVFFIGFAFQISINEWIFILLFALFFLVVEYLNTSIERIVDTVDDCEKMKKNGHYHPGLKNAKDTAASAALLALAVDVFILGLIFIPRILSL